MSNQMDEELDDILNEFVTDTETDVETKLAYTRQELLDWRDEALLEYRLEQLNKRVGNLTDRLGE